MTWIVLIVLLAVMFTVNMFVGSVTINPSTVTAILLGDASTASGAETYIILNSRLPAALTALLGGGALAVAGLLMQTAFRNPLAGPSIMGLNAGANLGVAIVMLLTGGTINAVGMELGGEIAVIAAALAGSLIVMAVLIFLSGVLRNNLMLLIAGILIGYLVSSIIMILNVKASSEGVQSYVMWGMGSFHNVGTTKLPLFALFIVLGLVPAMLLVKPLDALLLGDDYARNLGVDIARVRRWLLLSTGLLAALVTAYCGPVSFIGLAVPHIARLIVRTDLHRRLLPATFLTGALLAISCNVLCVIPSTGWLPSFASGTTLPLNAVTPLFGVPVILYVILRQRER